MLLLVNAATMVAVEEGGQRVYQQVLPQVVWVYLGSGITGAMVLVLPLTVCREPLVVVVRDNPGQMEYRQMVATEATVPLIASLVVLSHMPVVAVGLFVEQVQARRVAAGQAAVAQGANLGQLHLVLALTVLVAVVAAVAMQMVLTAATAS